MEQFFKNSQELHPEWGAYIHLCVIINGTEASRPEISKLFDKLMPEDEYDKEERGGLIDYLFEISNEKRYQV